VQISVVRLTQTPRLNDRRPALPFALRRALTGCRGSAETADGNMHQDTISVGEEGHANAIRCHRDVGKRRARATHFALELSSMGTATVVVARREQELADTAALIIEGGGTCEMIVADVTRPGSGSAEDAVARAETAFGPVDLLVSNAGSPASRSLSVPTPTCRSDASR